MQIFLYDYVKKCFMCPVVDWPMQNFMPYFSPTSILTLYLQQSSVSPGVTLNLTLTKDA